MRRYTTQTTKVLLVGALAVGTGAAIASEPERLYQDEVADNAGELAAGGLSDEKLHGFIDAAHEIVSLRAKFAGEIEGADAEEQAELQLEASERIAQAVEDNGLEIVEYRQIGYLLENDASLRDRLNALAATRG